MKSKIVYCINFLWTCFIAFTFPICFEGIYLCITGHSKGYDYNLGEEKDISILLGCIGLIIWFVLAAPSVSYIFRKTAHKGKKHLVIIAALYAALAALCIFAVLGGWSGFLKDTFNINSSWFGL